MISKYVSFDNITLSFSETDGLEKIIFNSLSLEIFSQKIYRLDGENGSGKSCLIKLIKGIYRPSKGLVTFSDGFKYFSPDFEEIPLNICVKDYLSFYSALNSKIISLLALEDVLNSKINDLSTGEKQRVALAPVFVEFYDMIILDESFKYIDEVRKRNISAAIKERYSGISTILYVEHGVEDLFNFDEILLIENKRIIRKEVLEESIINSREIPPPLIKKNPKYLLLLKSHPLVYSIVFFFIALLQITPSFIFSSFFPINKIGQLPVVTLKAKDDAIPENILKEFENFEKVKYSLEYTLKPKRYNPNLLHIDNRLKDDELYMTSNDINFDYESVGSFISYNSIVKSTLHPAADFLSSNCDPIIKIKKILSKVKGDNERRYYLSKRNYIILSQMINFYEKYYLYSSVNTHDKNIFELIITQKYDFPLAIRTHKNVDERDYPTKMTFVYGKEEKNSFSLPVVKVNDLAEYFLFIEMNLECLEKLVVDDSYISLIINNKNDYEKIKNIADIHDLTIYTNYMTGNKYNQIKITTNLAIWSFTILANVTIFLYPIKIRRRKFEVLMDKGLDGRAHLLIWGTSFVTIVISLLSIFIMKNWIFPLINIVLYLALIATYICLLRMKGAKHAKI